MSGEGDQQHGGTHQIGSNLGQSVVPDLMKVYESLTQSSTPHDGGNASHNQEQQQQQQQQTSYYQGDQQGITDHDHQQQQYAYAADPSGHEGYHQQQQDQQYQQHMYDALQQGHHEQEYQQVQPDIAHEAIPSLPPLPPTQTPSPAPAPSAPSRSSSRKRTRTSPPAGSDSNSDSGQRSGGRSGSARGGRGKSRKKSSSTDGRWSKRFQWPDELHREFVSAVFDVGLKHSSPSAIMEYMPPNECITSERVKSHLQKYRLHRARSKREFMSSYDAAAAKFRKDCPEGHLVDDGEIAALASGEVAAHLSCVAAATDDAASPVPSPLEASSPKEAADAPAGAAAAAAAATNGGVIHLPQLTEDEKRSPIGASMGYLMGLFFALQQQLSQQRSDQAKKEGVFANNQESAAVAPVSAPPVNPAGSNFGSYVAPPRQTMPSVPSSQPAHYTTPNLPQQQHAVATSSSAILEENNMMKRDMKAQMKLQNQMRAFKNKEVAKVQQQPERNGKVDADQPHVHFAEFKLPPESAAAAAVMGETAAAGETSSGEAAQDGAAAAPAGAAAAQSPALKGRGASFSDPEFWDSSVEDHELFEFLMS